MQPTTALPETVPSLDPTVAEYYPAEFWKEYYDNVEFTDEVPVDSEFSEKEMRLLAGSLNAFWKGPGAGGPFLAYTDVGLFYSTTIPPVAPDVMVSLVKPLPLSAGKKAQAYFVWEYGKPPDGVIEIVSNKKGGEETRKLKIYEEVGIPYYIIHDPGNHLGNGVLRIYRLVNGKYIQTEDTWLEKLGLGIRLWEGTFESRKETWLRWHDEKGELIPTPEEMGQTAMNLAERALFFEKQAKQASAQALQAIVQVQQANEQAQQANVQAQQANVQAQQANEQAQQASAQARQANERAERLAARLRELGIEPDQT